MYYELRQYHVRDGMMDQWLKLMKDTILPFQIEHGVVFMASFVSDDDPNLYIWLRKFTDQHAFKAVCKDYRSTDKWLKEIMPQIVRLLDRTNMDVKCLKSTSNSPL